MIARGWIKSLGMAALIGAAAVAGTWAGPWIRAAHAALFPVPEFSVGDFSALQTETGKSVVIFTTSTCPYCAKARALLGREKADFKDFVIDRSPAAASRLRELGLADTGVPLLLIGDRKIVGYRESSIRTALALLPNSN